MENQPESAEGSPGKYINIYLLFLFFLLHFIYLVEYSKTNYQ